MQQQGSASAAQHDTPSPTHYDAAKRDACEVAASDAEACSGDTFEQLANRASAHTQAAAAATEAAGKTVLPEDSGGSQRPSSHTYEELQWQLHTDAIQDVTNATASSTAVATKPSNERHLALRTVSVLASAERFNAAELLDPVHDPETHGSTSLQPLAGAPLQSSPHSGNHSPTSTSPVDSLMPPDEAAAASRDSSISHIMPANTGVSSPKTYEELQIALQRGYSQPSPKTEQREASASAHSHSNTANLQQIPQSRSRNSLEAAGRSQSKQTMSSIKVGKNGGNRGASSGKTSHAAAAVTTFNLPSSFFS
jgi:hypothetical protein